MNVSQIVVAGAIGLLLVPLHAQENLEQRIWEPSCALPVDPCPFYFASMASLLGSPGAWHGKLINVTGYARFDFEGTVLYMHRADFENDTGNAMWLNVPYKEFRNHPCHDKYCNVSGVFDAESQRGSAIFISIHSIRDAKPIQPNAAR